MTVDEYVTEFNLYSETYPQFNWIAAGLAAGDFSADYFDAGQTSGVVEGINNKARVILKRAYGLKEVDSLWTHLVLDLNRAKEVVKYTLGQIQELV